MQKGLTLIELLVVLAIGLGLVTTVFVVFPNLKNRKALEASSKLVVSVLEEARSTTLASKNASTYGVHLDSGQVVLFPGSTYTAGSVSNTTLLLNSATGIRNISLNGSGSNIIFNRLTGETNSYGTFQVYLLSDTTSYKTITVSRSGEVSESQ